MRIVASLIVLSVMGHAPPASAQPPRQPDGARLARAIERLGVVGRVLYVAAHPDDENTRLLTWLANDRLVRAAYLSITRGDGGQNLIGAEQGVDLGIVRTQELLAARAIDGAEQLFTRARDFGYSKSPDETMAIWGKEEILADVVWAIRRFRPDVVITRFPTSGLETHGHHTASAILAGEAFRLAGDAGYRPDQVAQAGVWKARRLVLNQPMFGAKAGTEPAGFLAVDVGGYDPALGQSYGEISAESRSMHKSQGFGVARQRGPSLEYFKVLDGEPMAGSLLDGVELGWSRVQGGKQVDGLIARARKAYDPSHPERALPALAAVHAALRALPASPLRQAKLDELDEVMIACAGLHLEATAAQHVVHAAGALPITLGALNRSPARVRLEQVRLFDGTIVKLGVALAQHRPWSLEHRAQATSVLTNPYWLDEPPTPGRFTVADADLVNQPERPPALAVELTLQIAGAPVHARRAVQHRWVDPVAGERARAIEVLDPVMVTPLSPLLLFADERTRPLTVRLQATVDGAKGEVRLALPPGFRAEPARLPYAISRGAEVELTFQVAAPPTASAGVARLTVELGGGTMSRSLGRIEHAHIPIQTRTPPAEVRLARLDLKHARTRIGYVAGAGDDVPAALRQVGYEVTMLTDAMLERDPLARWEAIVVGVRAFNTNPRLPFLHERLMGYVAAGGTLLVQYNTQNRISKAPPEIGPYPFKITQERVTDERAVVGRAKHPVLDGPNRIDDADFAGWVQERGLYFAGEWDARYEAPLSMSDPGEPARAGSLLVGRHGKGVFIYTGLSFFRQLPAGVPGAFRLFANLIDAR